MTAIVEQGSTWKSNTNEKFRILHVVELAGRTWIHYYSINHDMEYSCFLESFIEQFKQLPK